MIASTMYVFYVFFSLDVTSQMACEGDDVI